MITRHESRPSKVVPTSDGKYLLTVSYDMRIRIWDLNLDCKHWNLPKLQGNIFEIKSLKDPNKFIYLTSKGQGGIVDIQKKKRTKFSIDLKFMDNSVFLCLIGNNRSILVYNNSYKFRNTKKIFFRLPLQGPSKTLPVFNHFWRESLRQRDYYYGYQVYSCYNSSTLHARRSIFNYYNFLTFKNEVSQKVIGPKIMLTQKIKDKSLKGMNQGRYFAFVEGSEALIGLVFQRKIIWRIKLGINTSLVFTADEIGKWIAAGGDSSTQIKIVDIRFLGTVQMKDKQTQTDKLNGITFEEVLGVGESLRKRAAFRQIEEWVQKNKKVKVENKNEIPLPNIKNKISESENDISEEEENNNDSNVSFDYSERGSISQENLQNGVILKPETDSESESTQPIKFTEIATQTNPTETFPLDLSLTTLQNIKIIHPNSDLLLQDTQRQLTILHNAEKKSISKNQMETLTTYNSRKLNEYLSIRDQIQQICKEKKYLRASQMKRRTEKNIHFLRKNIEKLNKGLHLTFDKFQDLQNKNLNLNSKIGGLLFENQELEQNLRGIKNISNQKLRGVKQILGVNNQFSGIAKFGQKYAERNNFLADYEYDIDYLKLQSKRQKESKRGSKSRNSKTVKKKLKKKSEGWEKELAKEIMLSKRKRKKRREEGYATGKSKKKSSIINHFNSSDSD